MLPPTTGHLENHEVVISSEPSQIDALSLSSHNTLPTATAKNKSIVFRECVPQQAARIMIIDALAIDGNAIAKKESLCLARSQAALAAATSLDPKILNDWNQADYYEKQNISNNLSSTNPELEKHLTSADLYKQAAFLFKTILERRDHFMKSMEEHPTSVSVYCERLPAARTTLNKINEIAENMVEAIEKKLLYTDLAREAIPLDAPAIAAVIDLYGKNLTVSTSLAEFIQGGSYKEIPLMYEMSKSSINNAHCIERTIEARKTNTQGQKNLVILQLKEASGYFSRAFNTLYEATTTTNNGAFAAKIKIGAFYNEAGSKLLEIKM